MAASRGRCIPARSDLSPGNASEGSCALGLENSIFGTETGWAGPAGVPLDRGLGEERANTNNSLLVRARAVGKAAERACADGSRLLQGGPSSSALASFWAVVFCAGAVFSDHNKASICLASSTPL